MQFLLFPCVGHHIFDHLPVHQRFTAEEVHLQIPAGTGVGNEEIDGLFTHLQGHEGSVALVLALTGKAVVAGQVTGVGHMKTQGFDDRIALLEIKGHVGVLVRDEELAVLFQFLDAVQNLTQLLFGDVGLIVILLQHLPDDLLGSGSLVEGNNVIGHRVHHMD